jgi:hypothetical protein
VLQTIKVDIHKTPFILVNYDEVTSFNNQNWLSFACLHGEGLEESPNIVKFAKGWME